MAKAATAEKQEEATKTDQSEFEYLGDDGLRFLFRSRKDKKCYTVDKVRMVYRGEGGFRPEIMQRLKK